MRRSWKRFYRGLKGGQGSCDKTPLAPPAFEAPFCKGDVWIFRQRAFQAFKILARGTCIEMNRYRIARSGQLLHLSDDSVHIFVAKYDVGKLAHATLTFLLDAGLG